MDSTQIASNIVIMSRLQLTVEAIQRLHRLLTAADRLRYAELLAPRVGETAGHYLYRVKGFATTEAQLQLVGQVLYRLLQELAADYGQEQTYQTWEEMQAHHHAQSKIPVSFDTGIDIK